MVTKVIINPKTGMAETVNDYAPVSAEEVARTRKALRDMLSGNTPFHKDEYATPPAPKEKVEQDAAEDTNFMYGGYFGFAGVVP